jgi:hypothetical protein
MFTSLVTALIHKEKLRLPAFISINRFGPKFLDNQLKKNLRKNEMVNTKKFKNSG